VQAATEAIGSPAAIGENVESLTAELLEYMEQFRILLVIDNFETLATHSLRPILSVIPKGSKVLITSRIGPGELEIRYKLDPLDQKTAVSLARRFARALNIEILASASDARLEKYSNSLFRNPLLIKWFVQSVASGADPEKLAAKRGAEFESALRFCFENLFSRLSAEEKEILLFLSAARRPLTLTELIFLLHEVYQTDHGKLEAALSTLHNSSMLKRTPPEPRRQDTASQITLTDVAAEYISRFAPPDKKMFEKVQRSLKKLRELVEQAGVRQEIYKFDLYAIRTSTRDQLICATYLNGAIELIGRNDLTNARKQIAESKDLLPTFSENYRISALVEARDGDLYRAEEELNAALQHDPNSLVTRYQYAVFLLNAMEDAQSALVQLDYAIKLDSEDESLQTLRAMILTRLGKCKEAVEIYERILITLELRPRKWRISTRDQAAESFRRLAEQDRAMKDDESLKVHLGRALNILDVALGNGDFDKRTAALYANVLEDGLYYATQSRDKTYASEQLSKLSDALHVLRSVKFRRLSREYFERTMGDDSSAVAITRELGDQILWAPPRDESQSKPSSGDRIKGRIKRLPQGVLYGFIIDDAGKDWFVHKTCFRNLEAWTKLTEGDRVTFSPSSNLYGRLRATNVETD